MGIDGSTLHRMALLPTQFQKWLYAELNQDNLGLMQRRWKVPDRRDSNALCNWLIVDEISMTGAPLR